MDQEIEFVGVVVEGDGGWCSCGVGCGVVVCCVVCMGGGLGFLFFYIICKICEYEVLDEEGLSLIENNVDCVLEEIGIEFCEDVEVLVFWKEVGVDVCGECVYFFKGLCCEFFKIVLCEFIWYVCNLECSVYVGGKVMIFVFVYGLFFVCDFEGNCCYVMIEDFCNFVKFVYMVLLMYLLGGMVCELVDILVNKCYFDMVYSYIKYSDKLFMGLVIVLE